MLFTTIRGGINDSAMHTPRIVHQILFTSIFTYKQLSVLKLVANKIVEIRVDTIIKSKINANRPDILIHNKKTQDHSY